MFEGPPFLDCWGCHTPNLGVLDISDHVVSRRCRTCGWSVRDALPAVRKAVVYLDQFAISDIFKLRAGTLPTTANSYDFWCRVEPAIRRAYLLQQVVFPASPIHFKETNVSADPQDLRVAHEMLSGGVQFRRLEEIELAQIVPFAKAFLRHEPPPRLDLAPQDALTGSTDKWLPRLHLSVNSDYSMFAASQRENRDQAAAELVTLTEAWAAEKPTFQQVFKRELEAFGPAKLGSLIASLNRAARAQDVGDHREVFEASHTPAQTQFTQLAGLFRSLGVPEHQTYDLVAAYWGWAENQHLPFHRLSAYLFAALARKFAAGQRRPPSKGMLNDFEAISYFGPYVDAMLLDRECAGLLREIPSDPGHLLRAKMFSLANGDDFIAYLNSLADQAPEDVRRHAEALYRVS